MLVPRILIFVIAIVAFCSIESEFAYASDYSKCADQCGRDNRRDNHICTALTGKAKSDCEARVAKDSNACYVRCNNNWRSNSGKSKTVQ
jgi:hypothetical protein